MQKRTKGKKKSGLPLVRPKGEIRNATSHRSLEREKKRPLANVNKKKGKKQRLSPYVEKKKNGDTHSIFRQEKRGRRAGWDVFLGVKGEDQEKKGAVCSRLFFREKKRGERGAISQLNSPQSRGKKGGERENLQQKTKRKEKEGKLIVARKALSIAIAGQEKKSDNVCHGGAESRKKRRNPVPSDARKVPLFPGKKRKKAVGARSKKGKGGKEGRRENMGGGRVGRRAEKRGRKRCCARRWESGEGRRPD